MKNRIFIFSATLIILASCDFRTSSKNRLEEVADVKLSCDFEVLKDEYQDMGSDYCILYDIKFSKTASDEFIQNIEKSCFYNSQIKPNEFLKENSFIIRDKIKAVWYKSKNGYLFRGKIGLTDYTIHFDVVNQILNYQECAD